MEEERDLDSDLNHCFGCICKNYSSDIIADEKIYAERKNEFYPDDEFGERVYLCPPCYLKTLNYYFDK